MVCLMVAAMMNYHGREPVTIGWRLNIHTVSSIQQCMCVLGTVLGPGACLLVTHKSLN